MTSLKDSIAEDMVKLQQYIDSTVSTLTKHPATVEEIFEKDASYASISTSTVEVCIGVKTAAKDSSQAHGICRALNKYTKL